MFVRKDVVLVAAWGACAGWLLACFVVFLARGGAIPVPASLGSEYDPKALEKLFYLTFYLLGAVCAFVAAYFGRRLFRDARAAGLGALIFVPFAPHVSQAAVAGMPLAFWPALPPLDPQQWAGFSAQVVPLAYWVVLPPLALASAFFFDRIRKPAPSAPDGATAEPAAAARFTLAEVVWTAACGLLFATCLFPSDIETVTSRIGYNLHAVAFYVAPALFLWGHGLPNIDYFPQYGLGIGWFFSFLLRPTAGETIANAVLATATLCVFYFTSALVVLRRLYDSRTWAFIVVFFALLLTFHTSMSALGILLDPSAWPSRYPFLFLFVGLYARAVNSRRQTRDLVIAGAAAGLCLFWNTESGLYATASALVATVLLNGGARTTIKNLLAAAGGAALALFVLAAIAYGPGVFQPAFVTGLLKPLGVYAGGLGAKPIIWNSPLNLIYAVLSPLMGFATMGWTAAILLRKQTSVPRQTLVVLFLLAMIGNCLMLKWVNMSFDALWFTNSLPILAVTAWWIQGGLRSLARRSSAVRFQRGVTLVRAGLVVVMVLFLTFVADPRNPAAYGLQAFAIYPSVLLGPFMHVTPAKWDTSGEVSAADAELIRRCTKSHEPVMLVSDTDWVYLLAAGRPPKMPWLPSSTISAFPFLLEGAMRNTGPIFLEGDINRLKFDEPLDSAIRARMRAGNYRPVATGNKLTVYRSADAPPDANC